MRDPPPLSLRRPYTKIVDVKTYPKTENRKPINFSKEVFEIGGFGFLPISTCGKETKTSKMNNRWKTDVLEILEVLVFAFLVAFGRRHFSYMCAVRLILTASRFACLKIVFYMFLR